MSNQRLSRKILNICIVAVIIIAIVFVAMMFALNYDVNGEKNMPFTVSKITIISTVNGKDVENGDYKWDINVIQNNDIHLYIERNEEYKKQEIIDNIKIENITIKEKPAIGEIKIYKPSASDNEFFENIDENEINEVIFTGDKLSDTKNLKISNQGGIIRFRCANNNVSEYLSNDDEEINYGDLLQKINVNESDLKARVAFDIIITLNSGKSFKAENVEIEIPNEDIVAKGTVGKEITDLNNIIFKRIEN